MHSILGGDSIHFEQDLEGGAQVPYVVAGRLALGSAPSKRRPKQRPVG